MNNLLNNRDEVTEFEADFASADDVPDQRFLASLQRKLNMEEQPKKSRTVWGINPKLFYGLTAVGVLAIIGIIATAGTVIYISNQKNQDEQQLAILNAIALKNPSGLNSLMTNVETANGASRDLATGTSAKMAANSMMIYQPENTYSYYKIETIYGPMIEGLKQCEGYVSDEGVAENFSHYGKDKYISRSVEYDKDGKLVSEAYYGDKYRIEYQGGSFAIKTTEDRMNLKAALSSRSEVVSKGVATKEATSNSATSTSDTVVNNVVSPDIKALFGEDVQVLGQEVIDGKAYYVLTWSFDRYCRDSSTKKTIVKAWVDKESSVAYKNEYYFDSVSANNLQFSEILTSASKVVDFSAVQDQFEFSTNVPQKTIDMNALYAKQRSEYAQSLKNYWSGKVTAIVAPVNFNEISSVYSDGVTLNYAPVIKAQRDIRSRDFWPGTTAGQQAYEAYQNMMQSTDMLYPDSAVNKLIMSVNYTLDATSGKYAYVNSYAETNDLEKLATEQFGVSSDTEKQVMTMTLNGISVTGIQYLTNIYYEGMYDNVKVESAPFTGSGTSGSTEPAIRNIEVLKECPAGKTCTASLIRLFNYEGATFIVQEDVKLTGKDFETTNLTAFTKVSDAFNAKLDQLTKKVAE